VNEGTLTDLLSDVNYTTCLMTFFLWYCNNSLYPCKL